MRWGLARHKSRTLKKGKKEFELPPLKTEIQSRPITAWNEKIGTIFLHRIDQCGSGAGDQFYLKSLDRGATNPGEKCLAAIGSMYGEGKATGKNN